MDAFPGHRYIGVTNTIDTVRVSPVALTGIVVNRWMKRSPIRTFPVTLVMGAQLLAMVVIPAVTKGTEPLGLILAICAVAIASAFYIEILCAPLVVEPKAPRPIAIRAAWVVLIVGLVSSVGAALGGRGSYAVQLGLAKESVLVPLFTPFNIWSLFGAALFVWLFRQGRIPRRTAYVAVSLALIVQVYVGLERAILGQAAAFGATLLVLAILSGLIRLRFLLVLVMLIPLVWPTVYEYRDSVRRQIGGSLSAVSADDPTERLQLDEQMSLLEELAPHRQDLEGPSALTIIRTGLLPRLIDPNRPPLDTASQLSVATGSAESNSRSATFLGNVFLFTGMWGVMFTGAGLAVMMGMALRRSYSPWALMFVGLVYLTGISFNAAYPKGVVALLQAIESMLVAYLLTRYLSRNVERATPATREAPPDKGLANPSTRLPAE